jgi:hypothetical protein
VSTNERTSEHTESVVGEEDTAKVPVATDQSDPSKRAHKRHSTTTTEKASDDYCLERFKKNMRRNRSSKIKIA